MNCVQCSVDRNVVVCAAYGCRVSNPAKISDVRVNTISQKIIFNAHFCNDSNVPDWLVLLLVQSAIQGRHIQVLAE